MEELLRSSVAIRGVLVAPQLSEAPRGAALLDDLKRRGPVEEVAPVEFASAAETESPQGVIAIGEIPDRGFDSLGDSWQGVMLVLDAVQDPGNVGTILRTAAAFGAVATVTLPGTVDLWNAKVVRSGMGAHFNHPAFSTTWPELDAFRARTGLSLLAADASGEPVSAAMRTDRVGLVVGNEGSGLSHDARSRADRVVSLSIEPGIESLNVAVAAGVLLYLLAR